MSNRAQAKALRKELLKYYELDKGNPDKGVSSCKVIHQSE